MKISKVFFWLFLSIIVFFTRFYNLSQSPVSLTIDEVAIGYNAYSILKTSRDEWGTFMPTSFRSVGDFKSPTLIYLTVPFVAILGLTELAVRLPVAIFSALNIILFFIFVSKFIFKEKFQKLSYLSTAIFALSPWMIPFSRSGFEAIPALSFMLVNLIYFFKGTESGKIYHFLASFLFAILSAITYHSTKIVVPLVNLFLVFQYREFILQMFPDWSKKNRFSFWLSLIVISLVSVLLAKFFIIGDGSSRAQMTLLTKDFDFDRAIVPTLESLLAFSATHTISLLLFWYKRFLEYLSPNFYLTSGLGLVTPGHPGQGTVYLIEYLFLVIGFFVFIFKVNLKEIFRNSDTFWKVLVVWLLAGLLPATITNNSQHALRTLNIVPVIAILISLGISYAYSKFRNNLSRKLFAFTIIILCVLSFLRFTDFYFLHYPVELSEARSYGWKQMAIYARDNHSQYEKVYVDPRFGTDGPFTYGVPHLYFLFYSQYDPVKYHSGPQRLTGSTDFENYIFGPINWSDLDHENNLYVASPWSFPKELINSDNQKYYIPFLNNSSGLYAISDR